MRNWAITAVVFGAALAVASPISFETFVKPTSRASKHLVFVVDVSGSMTGARLQAALASFRLFAGSGTDQGYLRVYAFSGSFARRPWAKLPNATELEAAEAWLLAQHEDMDGTTNLIPALVGALAEKPRKLTVVVVTDGELGASLEQILVATKKAQKKRKLKAMIGVVGVGHKKPKAKLKALAELYGGGYYGVQVAKKDGPY